MTGVLPALRLLCALHHLLLRFPGQAFDFGIDFLERRVVTVFPEHARIGGHDVFRLLDQLGELLLGAWALAVLLAYGPGELVAPWAEAPGRLLQLLALAAGRIEALAAGR